VVCLQGSAAGDEHAGRLQDFLEKILDSSSSSNSGDGNSSSGTSAEQARRRALQWDKFSIVGELFDVRLPAEDAKFLGEWLVQQPAVLNALEAWYVSDHAVHMMGIAEQPSTGHLLLQPAAQRIFRAKDNTPDFAFVDSTLADLLKTALAKDGGEALAMLLDNVEIAPKAAAAAVLTGRLVHPGAIKQVAAHLPKLLDIGLAPDCRVSATS